MTAAFIIPIIILIVVGYLCLYSLTNRICQCIEHCATAKAYGKFQENTGKAIKMEDMKKEIQNQKV